MARRFETINHHSYAFGVDLDNEVGIGNQPTNKLLATYSKKNGKQKQTSKRKLTMYQKKTSKEDQNGEQKQTCSPDGVPYLSN